MSFFSSLLHQQKTNTYSYKPLWTYDVQEPDFVKLRERLASESIFQIDPRDAALYYSEWWKRCYKGGKPSKQDIYDSLLPWGRPHYDKDAFYKLAKDGAQQLGIKWIRKQNTLYFRSLLLQGGLPLTHISQNQGAYQNFLQAVLDEQPETIEDFALNPDILKYLPSSSQNDIVYENCLAIVKSILKDENTYDILFESNESLKRISDNLKIQKKSLRKRTRQSKPKNYWLLRFREDRTEISLRIGLADSYEAESLENILGFYPEEREYQLYVNEELICAFRKMINGAYRTDWYDQQNQVWNGESNLPYTYTIGGGNKREINDFIQSVPDLAEPSLWTRFSDDEWRLVKGGGTGHKEAALLFPDPWHSDLEANALQINDVPINWMPFEGKISLTKEDETRSYQSEVKAFEWTIISDKPNWILKGNMPIIRGKLNVNVYDEQNRLVPAKRYEIWGKRRSSRAPWEQLDTKKGLLPEGCIDIKIIFEGITAYDVCFNIGRLHASFPRKAINRAKIMIEETGVFQFELDESPVMEISRQGDRYSLNLESGYSRVPTSVKGTVGLRNQKSLRFDMRSPFEGLAITDRTGRILEKGANMSFADLYGMRILSSPGVSTTLIMKNGHNQKIGIILQKEIKEPSYPLISFIDDITRLLYLDDVMDYRNKVSLTLVEGDTSETYSVSKFSHTLDVEQQREYQVQLYESEDELDLFAIPLNGPIEDLEAIPLHRDGQTHTLPKHHSSHQFIVISALVVGTQLMPRFVNTDEAYLGIEKGLRISQFHSGLSEATFSDEAWVRVEKYFNLCEEYQIPYSTFDQIRALSISSQVAARAFFFLGVNSEESDVFIQKVVPNLEQELGFCFHWIYREDWEKALYEVITLYGEEYFKDIVQLLNQYLVESGVEELAPFITAGQVVSSKKIRHSDIRDLRARLGEKVLRELPNIGPDTQGTYQIPIHDHKQVEMILRSAIAVAESIMGIQVKKPIWGGDDFRGSLRRYIQYSQYLDPQFYSDTILHVLSNR